MRQCATRGCNRTLGVNDSDVCGKCEDIIEREERAKEDVERDCRNCDWSNGFACTADGPLRNYPILEAAGDSDAWHCCLWKAHDEG